MIEYELAYRQGEILFFKVKKIPSKYSYMKPKPVPDGVIREGEKEGHQHKVCGNGQLSMFDMNDEGILTAKDPVTITHPEHKDIKLPKGDYVVKVQKEATGRNTAQSVKD